MPASPLLYEFRRELPFYLRCTPSTAEKSYYAVRAFLRRHSPFPDAFTRDNVVEHLSWLSTTPPYHRDGERRAASTVNETLKSLKRFAKWAVARDMLPSNPIADLRGLRADDPVMLPPQPAEVVRFLTAVRIFAQSAELRARDYAVVCILIDTGVRAAELLKLDVGDVHDDYLMVQGKGGKHRLVSLNPTARDAVRAYLKVRRAVSGEHALFISHAGRRLSYPALRNTFQKVSRVVGVKVNPHDLRRFAHTHLWMEDISQIDGMLISGHSDPQVYQRYIRAAMQLRALREHRARSPLDALLR